MEQKKKKGFSCGQKNVDMKGGLSLGRNAALKTVWTFGTQSHRAEKNV
jgi:hypothetical protein